MGYIYSENYDFVSSSLTLGACLRARSRDIKHCMTRPSSAQNAGAMRGT